MRAISPTRWISANAGCSWVDSGELKVGDKFEIQYRHKRAQFRVVWVMAREGSSEKQIGAECVEPEKWDWGVEFPEQTDEYEEQE
jgi:hypothetical protein